MRKKPVVIHTLFLCRGEPKSSEKGWYIAKDMLGVIEHEIPKCQGSRAIHSTMAMVVSTCISNKVYTLHQTDKRFQRRTDLPIQSVPTIRAIRFSA